MVYDNLQEWEVVRLILEKNPNNKNPKQIAAYLGVHLSIIYKWGQDPEFSGSPIPKDKILPFTHFTGDNRLMGFYVYQIGGEIIPLKSGTATDGEFMDDLMRLDRWRGVLSDLILDYMRDAKLDKKEITGLLEITEKMKNEINNFQEELRLRMKELR